MNRRTLFSTIFICVVTLSALIIFITNYNWFLMVISQILAIVHHAGIDIPIGLLALLVTFSLFFTKMDKKSKYITISMCIITLSAPYIFMLPFIICCSCTGYPQPWIADYYLFWCLFVTSPTSVAARCAAHYAGFGFFKLLLMDITNSLTVLIISFFFQMLITWMIVLRFSKIEKRFIRRLSYCIVLAVYIIFMFFYVFTLSL